MARELVILAVLVACRASADDNRPAFRVEVAPPAACSVGAACEARVKLTALGPYKVNDEYPFKFVADKSAAVVVDGKGKFARDGAKTGTLVITFRAQAAGTTTVSGTFKLSVCTPEVCKIESPKVTFSVPVT
jgi:hypothetical protein